MRTGTVVGGVRPGPNFRSEVACATESKKGRASLFAQGREQRSRVNGYRLLRADGGGCSLTAPDDLARGSGLLHDDPPCHLPKNNAGPPRSAASICENGRSDGSAIALKSAPRKNTKSRLAAPLLVKCCRRFVQCRSVFGHAKRNCASEAYEPPLKFGMIASSKAATSSNST